MELKEEISKSLTEKVRYIISDEVDKEIEKKVNEFRTLLTREKAKFMSKIAENIIIQVEDSDLTMNYKIIFKNKE